MARSEILVLLQWGNVAFNALAASLWFASARVFIPKIFVLEGTYLGSSQPDKKQRLDPLMIAVRKQSQWGAAAAASAAAAALLQGVANWLGT
jgi:hypothetical protein